MHRRHTVCVFGPSLLSFDYVRKDATAYRYGEMQEQTKESVHDSAFRVQLSIHHTFASTLPVAHRGGATKGGMVGGVSKSDKAET